MVSRPSVEYTRSISSLTPSSSHPSIEPSPALNSALSLSTSTSVSTRHRSRQSFSLFGKLPQDFSSLGRSHRTPVRRSVTLEGSISPAVHFTEYDEVVSAKHTAMYRTQEEDRQARKTKKSEHRFYHFLTRSRSRSRTKQDSSPADLSNGITEFGHSFHHSKDSSSSKIPSLTKQQLQSRPISTTTGTTISPPTPKPRSNVTTAPLKPPKESETTHSSPPPTPKSSARKKLHNIFSLPLSRKGSVSSRPTSPEPRTVPLDISSPPRTPERRPHIPTDPGAPKLWTARVPTPNRTPTRSPRPESPAPPHSEPFDIQDGDVTASVSTHESSHSHHRSSKTNTVNGIRVSHPRPRTSASGIPASATSKSNLSDEADVFSHRGEGSASSSSHRQAPLVSSQLPTPHSRNHAIQSRPRSSSLTRELSSTSSLGTATNSASRLPYRKDSMDSTHRYRPMTIVTEERGSGDFSSTPTADPGRMHLPPKSEVKSTRSSATRSTKHGSFDFERPGWGSLIRSGNGTPTTVREKGKKDRPLQKSVSLRDSEESRARQTRSVDPPQPTSPHKRSQSDDPALSPVQTSSLGRSTGRRTFGGGLARMVGLTHGPFSFEPPVPSPTHSHFSASSAVSSSRNAAAAAAQEKEKAAARQRERKDRQEEKERRKEARRTAHLLEAPPVPPKPVPADTLGYRSAHKGRSLDLGLGLAWAPRKIKEDALLPSSFAFEKSASASSKKSLARRDGSLGMEVDRSKVGKEVAEMFKTALDVEGYATFRKFVHRFDALEIPFDGPTGILSLTEDLLNRSTRLSSGEKRRLLDSLVRIILQNA